MRDRKNPVYARKHRGNFRGSNHCNEWRKWLNIDDFVYFELLKIGNKSKVKPGNKYSSYSSVKLESGRIALHEAEILHLVVQNAGNPGVKEGKMRLN